MSVGYRVICDAIPGMPSIQTNLANTCRRRSCDLVTVKTSSAPKSRRFADGAAGQHNKNGVLHRSPYLKNVELHFPFGEA